MRTYKDTCGGIADIVREYAATSKRQDIHHDRLWELEYAFAGVREVLRDDLIETVDRGYVPMALSYGIIGSLVALGGQLAPEQYRTFLTNLGVGFGVGGIALGVSRAITGKPYRLLETP